MPVDNLWWFAGGLIVGLMVAYAMHWMAVKLASWGHCPICEEAGVDYCLEEEEEE